MLKFIFVTILVIFFIRLVAPILFRWLLAFFVKKSLRNGTFFYSNMNQQRPEPRANNNGKQQGGSKLTTFQSSLTARISMAGSTSIMKK
jgi:hypothetical protein